MADNKDEDVVLSSTSRMRQSILLKCKLLTCELNPEPVALVVVRLDEVELVRFTTDTIDVWSVSPFLILVSAAAPSERAT